MSKNTYIFFNEKTGTNGRLTKGETKLITSKNIIVLKENEENIKKLSILIQKDNYINNLTKEIFIEKKENESLLNKINKKYKYILTKIKGI